MRFNPFSSEPKGFSAVAELALAVVIAKLPVILHSPEIVGERSPVARIERVGLHYMPDVVDGAVEKVLFVAPLIEAALEIEQSAARFVEALAIGAGSIRICAGAIEVHSRLVEQTAVLPC